MQGKKDGLDWPKDDRHDTGSSPSKAKLSQNQIFKIAFSTSGGNRTHTLLLELDFESSASTNSATEALQWIFCRNVLIHRLNYDGKKSIVIHELILDLTNASKNAPSSFKQKKYGKVTIYIGKKKMNLSKKWYIYCYYWLIPILMC